MDMLLAEDKYIRKVKAMRWGNGPRFLLSLDEYCSLMIKANITPDQIGAKRGMYVLGRKNGVTGEVDSGDYIIGNCRFITHEANCKEANHSKSEEHKENLRIAALTRDDTYCKSEERRETVSKQFKGIPKLEQHRKKIGDASRGRVVSEETRKKISDNHSMCRPILTCPHCNKSGRYNITRYHFDNCKFRGETV